MASGTRVSPRCGRWPSWTVAGKLMNDRLVSSIPTGIAAKASENPRPPFSAILRDMVDTAMAFGSPYQHGRPGHHQPGRTGNRRTRRFFPELIFDLSRNSLAAGPIGRRRGKIWMECLKSIRNMIKMTGNDSEMAGYSASFLIYPWRRLIIAPQHDGHNNFHDRAARKADRHSPSLSEFDSRPVRRTNIQPWLRQHRRLNPPPPTSPGLHLSWPGDLPPHRAAKDDRPGGRS